VADFVLPVVFGSAASVAGIGAVFVSGAALLILGAGALADPMVADVRSARNSAATSSQQAQD
jgi:hypothetical protein